MKTIVLVLFFSAFGMTSLSQTYRITGSVTDNQNSKVNYAGVLIVQNDSILQYELTDEDGIFSLDEKQGNYKLFIQQFGNTLFSKDIVLDRNIDLGVIIVQQALKLSEVTITARKKLIERKLDRLVFNVENSISSTGGNALDILSITPRISAKDDQITMIGKSTMIVTINDRLLYISGNDLVNYLKSIPSDNIASVEVISNPHAKYESEGNSGIVNIRLKTPKANSWNASISSSYQQSTYCIGNMSGRFTYQKNNLSFSSSISYRDGSSSSFGKETFYYPDKTFFEKREGRDFTKGFNGQFGIDYRLNKKLTVGTQYSGSFSKPKSENTYTATISDLNNTLQQTLKTDHIELSENNYNTLNVHSIYNMDSLGRKLTLDVDYFNYAKNQNQTYATNNYDANNAFIDDSYSSRKNTGQQNIENYSVKLDMQHPSKWLKLNYGGKISSTTTNNDLKYYDLSLGKPEYDDSQSNEFRYTENNQSLYLSAEKDLSEKWNLQLGLRLENTKTKCNSLTLEEKHDNHYTKLFPTLYLTYIPNDNHSLSLNYGRRISRPKFSMLNPFRTYTNPYISIEGNPYLEPSFMNNIELGYTFMNNMNVALYYSDESNGYSLITMVEPNSIIQTSKMLNFYTNNGYGANVSYTFNKFKWLESYLSGDINYSITHADYPGVPKNTEGWGAHLGASNSFFFNSAKTFLGSLILDYFSPSTYGISKNKASFIADMSLRYILNKNLTINFSLRDIFKTNTQQWNKTNNGIQMYYYNYSDARRITLSVSWRFGNNKINSRDVKAGNVEEKNRAN